MSVASMFNDVFEHWRPALSDDNEGGYDATYEDRGSFVGRYSTPSAREIESFERFVARISSVVYCAFGTDVMRDDILRPSMTGKILRVVAIDTPSQPIYHKLLCEETQELNDAISALRGLVQDGSDY